MFDSNVLSQIRDSVLRELNDGLDSSLRFVDSSEEFLDSVREVLVSVRLVLGCVAAISLLVVTLNIVNVMHIAALERQDEIAVMSALGMSRGALIGMFLFESVMLVLLFSALGFMVGTVASAVIAAALDVEASFFWVAVGVLLPITAGVGIGGGILPALRAVGADPARLMR